MQRLVKEGYENIVVVMGEEETVAAFEDGVYRNSVRGLTQALLYTVSLMPTGTKRLRLVQQKYGVPTAAFSAQEFATVRLPKSGRRLSLPKLTVDEDPAAYRRLLRKIPAARPSFWNADLILHPDLKAVIGNYDDPMALQVNVIPEFRLTLFRGGLLSFSAIVPLYNELESYAESVRIGPTYMTFFTAFPRSWYFYSSLGYFYDERLGVQALIRKLVFSGKLAFDLRTVWSGTALMDKGQFLYEPPRTFTASLEATYFFPRYRLFLNAGFHGFIEQDTGVRLEAFRFFNDLRLGVWAVAAGGEWNGGLRIALPLPPSRYSARHRFRIRSADYFVIGYQARRELYTGKLPEKSEVMDELLIYNFPAYLQSHIAVGERTKQ